MYCQMEVFNFLNQYKKQKKLQALLSFENIRKLMSLNVCSVTSFSLVVCAWHKENFSVV